MGHDTTTTLPNTDSVQGETAAKTGPFRIAEKPKVVAVNATGRLGFAQFQSCWLAVASQLGIVCVQTEGLHWEQHLTLGIKQALQIAPDADYILFLDWDSVFTPEDVTKLIEFMQIHPELAACFPQQMTRHEAHHDTILCDDPFLDYDGEYTEKPYGHFGCTLIRAEVFRDVPQPWFHAFAGENGWDDPRSVHADILFWRLLKDNGYRTAQVNDVQIGHLELCVLWPDGDMRRVQLASEYRKYGRPPGVRWTGKKKTPDGFVRLNLGSGRHPLQNGFFSIDGLFGDAVYPLPQFEDGSVDEIYASHILEHFSHRDTEKVLREWARVLKPGGRIRIAVPDFRFIAAEYLKGDRPFNLNGLVMGGHVRGDDVHGSTFDATALGNLMQSVGFTGVRRFHADGLDTSSGWFSLNLEGVKAVPGRNNGPVPGEVDEWVERQWRPSVHPELVDERFAWLSKSAGNITSQFGEDGIVRTIFDRIGGGSTCVDCGAGDGRQYSNTAWCRGAGWSAWMIESDERFLPSLQSAPGPNNVVSIAAVNDSNTLDQILDRSAGPEVIDLLSLDIDGDEDAVWLSLRRKPRVVVVEHADLLAGPGPLRSATRERIAEVAADLGYTVVAVTRTNSICVRNDQIDRLLDDGRARDLRKDGDELGDSGDLDNDKDVDRPTRKGRALGV